MAVLGGLRHTDFHTTRPALACARALYGAMVMACVLAPSSAPAQDPVAPDPAPQAEAPPANPPENRPGFLDALGRWLGAPAEAIGSGIKSTQETLGNVGSKAGGAARDAASGVAAIPGTRIISGRHVCPVSSNGAPDCQLGAEAFCREKGFQSGRHLDVMSGQRCSVKNWLDGGRKRDAACRTETYVTRAVCQ